MSSLTDDDKRRIRANIRNFLLVATDAELRRELTLSIDRGDAFRAACVRELIDESRAD